MFIKMKHHITDKILVLNIDVESYIDFYVDGSNLMLSKASKHVKKDAEGNKVKDEFGDDVIVRDRDSIPFKTADEAEFARDSLFNNLGTNSPFNKVLDLTVFSQMEDDTLTDDFIYVDVKDIAKKFKVDTAKLRIVDVSNQSKADGVDDELIIEDKVVDKVIIEE